MSREHADSPAGGGFRDPLARAAIAWGSVILVLAALLPIETVDSGRAGVQPRYSLVAVHGPGVLLIAAIPLLAAAVVPLLLKAGTLLGTVTARTLAIGLLLAAGIGFITFVIGIFVVPSGLLLVAATFRGIREMNLNT